MAAPAFTPLRYVPPDTDPLPAGTWTLILPDTPTGQQIIRLGTPPQPGDVVQLLWLALA